MDDPFILVSDPEAMRGAGIPWSAQTAIRKSREGEFIPLVILSPHRRGYFLSAVRGWLNAQRVQQSADAA